MSKLKYQDMRIVSKSDYESVYNQNTDLWQLAKKIADSKASVIMSIARAKS